MGGIGNSSSAGSEWPRQTLLGVLMQRCVEGTGGREGARSAYLKRTEEQIIWKANGAKFNIIILCLVKTIPWIVGKRKTM